MRDEKFERIDGIVDLIDLAAVGPGKVWRIYGDNSYPLLRSFLTAVAAGANVGTWATRASGVYADQQGYGLTFANGTLTVDKANLTVSTSNVSKTYDGNTSAAGAAVITAGTLLGTDAISGGTFAFTNKNAGTGKAVTVSGLSLSGAAASNYKLPAQPTGLTAAITPKSLIITAQDDSKTYTGLAYMGGNGVSYNGLVSGESAADLAGALAYGGSSQGAAMAGNYVILPTGLSSQNYAISYADGALKINPPVALDAIVASLNKPQPGAVDASSEKFILGGPGGVRAYPSGEGSGDAGWVSNLELRYELPDWTNLGSLQLLGFADTGRVTLHRNPWAGAVTNAGNANSYGLSGAGMGVNLATRGDWSLRTTLAWTLGDNPGRSASTPQNADGRTDSWRFWVQMAAAF